MKKIRNKLGLTQTELALLLGVHPITVSKWERGCTEPTKWQLAILEAIASGPACEEVGQILYTCGPAEALALALKHLTT